MIVISKSVISSHIKANLENAMQYQNWFANILLQLRSCNNFLRIKCLSTNEKLLATLLGPLVFVVKEGKTPDLLMLWAPVRLSTGELGLIAVCQLIRRLVSLLGEIKGVGLFWEITPHTTKHRNEAGAFLLISVCGTYRN